MSPTLAFSDPIWSQLVSKLDLKVETAGFILAGLASDDNEISFFARSIKWVPEEHYSERTATALKISSLGYVPQLGASARDQSVPVFLHTHPGMTAVASRKDAKVDEVLRSPALLRSRAPFYVSLIIGGTRDRPTFTGHVFNAGGSVAVLERIRIIGRRVRVVLAEDAEEEEVDEKIFDRQIRAFGKDGQKVLARLRVGVIGAGGTGSAVFEQLVRSGVKNIVVIDDDSVTDTNITRIHESGIADSGTPKVDVMQAAAAHIGLGPLPHIVNGRITDSDIARNLRHLDVVFGCTDDERGRLVLSKFSLSHLICVFDMGFAVVPNQDKTTRELDGRVTTLLPGAACLLCRSRISPQGLAAEALNPEERKHQALEGYVPGLADADPAVGTYTTLVASFAVNELLDRLFGYSVDSGAFGATELLLRLHDRRLNFNSRTPGNHWCGDVTNYGRGDISVL
jgi:molybdopterin/thiamine biosynthesis adenylyltransferase/proteasome lid subunit RPN8/RPN11